MSCGPQPLAHYHSSSSVLSCLQAFPHAVCPCRAFYLGRRHSGFASSKKLSSVLLPPSSKQDQTHFSVIVLCSPRVTQKLLTSRGQLLHDSHVAMATLGIWYGLNTEIPVKGFESIHPKQSAMYWDLTRGCCQLIVIRGRFLEGPLEPRSQILKINLSYPPPEQLREPCQMLSGTSPT